MPVLKLNINCRTWLVFFINGIIAALAGFITGNSTASVRLLAGENTRQGRLE
jgi:ABC-type xylose transport system permease subunit